MLTRFRDCICVGYLCCTFILQRIHHQFSDKTDTCSCTANHHTQPEQRQCTHVYMHCALPYSQFACQELRHSTSDLTADSQYNTSSQSSRFCQNNRCPATSWLFSTASSLAAGGAGHADRAAPDSVLARKASGGMRLFLRRLYRIIHKHCSILFVSTVQC